MKKIILIIIFLLFILSGTILISSSGLIKIPLFSNIFYVRRVADLGIESNSEAGQRFSEKLGISSLGISGGRILPKPEVITMTVTDVEVTSWINALCQENFDLCPFENFQIKFEKEKFKSSVHLFEPIEADVTVFGSVAKKDEFSIDLSFDKVYLGNLPAPAKINKMLENAAEEHINERLDKLAGFRIDEIQILDGEAVFVGIIPYLPFGKEQKQGDYHIMF